MDIRTPCPGDAVAPEADPAVGKRAWSRPQVIESEIAEETEGPRDDFGNFHILAS